MCPPLRQIRLNLTSNPWADRVNLNSTLGVDFFLSDSGNKRQYVVINTFNYKE